ncbi:MAG TPA: 4Fe-4S dicluster domain-containing protein [Anaerolineales bacterium]|nr:4Fe-4S dicluster domain-containing protein [Anaerolineales bacterium]
MDAYQRLAEHLDALPNGFPPTADGSELRILQKLFTPEEADIAARLTSQRETVDEIAARTNLDAATIRDPLKSMARRGLIEAGVKGKALAFETLPFVVGIYEMQVHRMDAELARLVEDYFRDGFGKMLSVQPQFHRVIPAHEAEHDSLEVQPFESAASIIDSMQSWAVLDCICRKQKALIGQPCKHPIDVCLAMAPSPGAFDEAPTLRALTREEAMATLQRAAEAGLVHTVTNTVEGTSYICNCCTCSCGILRGMAELGLANVVASSPFVNTVQDVLCTGCEACIDACQFTALTMDGALAKVDRDRCVGCGVCVLTCKDSALVLVRRPEDEIKPVPQTGADWRLQRSAARAM